MWIKKAEYDELKEANDDLAKENIRLHEKIKDLEGDSGEAMLTRLKHLAKECGIDIHSDEYQTFMHRMFMGVAGRVSPEAKAYSRLAFVKDNPAELIERAKQLTKQASIITAEIEHKKKK